MIVTAERRFDIQRVLAVRNEGVRREHVHVIVDEKRRLCRARGQTPGLAQLKQVSFVAQSGKCQGM